MTADSAAHGDSNPTARESIQISGNYASRAALASRFDLRGLVYASDAMHAVVQMATKVARADVPVLITGPNGAGKEVIAEIIQANSSVRDGPFVRVDIGALPAELLESELFGAEAGAYTSAKTRAARDLGLTHQSLYRRMERLGIASDEPGGP